MHSKGSRIRKEALEAMKAIAINITIEAYIYLGQLICYIAQFGGSVG